MATRMRRNSNRGGKCGSTKLLYIISVVGIHYIYDCNSFLSITNIFYQSLTCIFTYFMVPPDKKFLILRWPNLLIFCSFMINIKSFLKKILPYPEVTKTCLYIEKCKILSAHLSKSSIAQRLRSQTIWLCYYDPGQITWFLCACLSFFT